MRDKYKCDNDIIPTINANRNGSNTWAGIKHTWKKVSEGINVDPDTVMLS